MARFCSVVKVFRPLSAWLGNLGVSMARGIRGTGGIDVAGAEKLPDDGVGFVN